MPGSDPPAPRLLERRKGGVRRVQRERLGAGEPLGGPPASRRLSAQVLARHRGVDAEQGVLRLDREVASAGEARPAVH